MNMPVIYIATWVIFINIIYGPRSEEVGHDLRGMRIELSRIICSGLTWVAWAYIASYGKRALIRIREQPPLGPDI
jgi:hypothetical protein